MKVVVNKYIPIGSKYYAINLFGILFAKGPCTARILNHESIHSRQIWELLGIFFYLWYIVEWMVRIIIYGNAYKAYRNISFEREAYANGDNLRYLSTRKPYAFLHYIKKGQTT